MEDQVVSTSIRAFLKKVGITSQRELEQRLQQAGREGLLEGKSTLQAQMTLSIEGLGVITEVNGQLHLK